MGMRPGDRDGGGRAAGEAPRRQGDAPGNVTSIWHDYLMLLVKIGFLFSVIGVMMTTVFGAYRVQDEYMSPAVKDGDLIIYYRLVKHNPVGEVVIFEYEGNEICGRIVAQAGDTVNISAQGLMVNGVPKSEPGIYEETTQVADGVTFPLVIPEHSVFLLGDNRTVAVDSRIVGSVDEDNLLGTIIGIFRRRNF